MEQEIQTEYTDEPAASAAPESATPESSPESGGESSGAWPKDVQAEFTKKAQALADERRQFQGQQQQWQSQQAQQQQQMQQYQQQMQQHYGQQGQQQQNQMLDQLRGMSYLDGPTAAQLMERIINEGITPLQQAVQQRDKALAHVYQEYKALKGQVGQHTSKSAEAALSDKFAKARVEHSLPDEPWVNDYLQDVYYSHEGHDLDAEYGNMVRARLDTMRKGFREMDRATAAKAKAASPFPGKGGEVSMTDGKTGGYKTPQQRADELWPMMNSAMPQE